MWACRLAGLSGAFSMRDSDRRSMLHRKKSKSKTFAFAAKMTTKRTKVLAEKNATSFCVTARFRMACCSGSQKRERLLHSNLANSTLLPSWKSGTRFLAALSSPLTNRRDGAPICYSSDHCSPRDERLSSFAAEAAEEERK